MTSKFAHGIRIWLLGSVLLLGLASPSADAWWFKKKAKDADPVQTYQPPPPDAVERECAPLRNKIAKLKSKSKTERLLMSARMDLLKRRYNKCKGEIIGQQFEYLRHVDIQKGPSLPAIRPEGEVVGPVPEQK